MTDVYTKPKSKEHCGMHHFANVGKLCKSILLMRRKHSSDHKKSSSSSSSHIKLDAAKKKLKSMDLKLSKLYSDKNKHNYKNKANNPDQGNLVDNHDDKTCTPKQFSRNKSAHGVPLSSHRFSFSQPLKHETSTMSRSLSSFSRSTSQKRQPGPVSRSISTKIMFSNSTGVIKPPVFEQTLSCTLEEICFGCLKKVEISRDVVTDDGEIVQEDERLTIKVKPGWTNGTKITFEGMGNEIPGGQTGDVTFVIKEKKHPLFKKEGDDLVFEIQIPLVKALVGCRLSIPLLDGENMPIKMEDVIYPGYRKIVAGQGMPKAKEPEERGDLIVKFEVDFPEQLTHEQRADVYNILHDSC